MLKPGDRIAEWIVMKPLGFGGMGAVYLVHHFRMRETVLAMKLLLPEVAVSHPETHGKRASSAGKTKELGQIGNLPPGQLTFDFHRAFAGIPP